ncbi:MAG: hypothetical protein FD174_1408 [Geobacteraceae bacterium]|nr:MAG: hypothetical protein FD174_1408 [Geobacteraceae bacterium]
MERTGREPAFIHRSALQIIRQDGNKEKSHRLAPVPASCRINRHNGNPHPGPMLTALLLFLLTMGQTILMKPDVIANWQYLVLTLACAALSAPEKGEGIEATL